MRVPPVGPGKAWTPSAFGQVVEAGGVVPARQLERRVRANGWCRAHKHTRKRRRDQPVLNDVVGRWSNTLHRPTAEAGKRRAGERCLGTGKVRPAGSPTNPWSQCHDDVKRSRFSHATAQPPWLCNGNKRNTARADGPTHAGLSAGRADVCEPHATEVPHEPFSGWGTTEAGADLRLRRTRAARVVPGRISALEIVPANNLLPLFACARSRRGRPTRRWPRVTSLVHTAIRRRGAAQGTPAAGPGALAHARGL